MAPPLSETARNLATSRHPNLVLARFLCVGAVLTAGYSLLSSALALAGHLAPAWASAISYGLWVAPGYWAQRRFAFRSEAPHARAFVRYAALQAPLLALGAALSWLFITELGGRTILSFLLIGPLVAVVSFLAQRAWAFKQH